MNNFKYYTPTKVMFGEGTEENLPALLKQQNAKKVLLHYGGKSAVKSGLIDRVKKMMDDAGISYVELGGVVPNPRLSLVYKGIELCKKEGVDFLLAVGGGSVIDSAKAIAYGAVYDGDVWDFYDKKAKPEKALGVGVILTLAATGSEMSDSSVITNEDGQKKRGCNSDLSRPRFAILDPTFTMTLPAYQTSCGCTDIIMHTLERWFTSKGNMDLTDGIAASVIKTVMKYAPKLLEDPNDYKGRAEVMWAGTLSHNGLTGCGNGGNDFATHRLEHEVSGIYDIAHGAGLAAIWGSWARYVKDNCPERFVKFAEEVMDIDPKGLTEDEIIEKGIAAMEEFFRSIDMPVSLKELGIDPSDEDLKLLAKKCFEATGGPFGAAKLLDEEDFFNIYKKSIDGPDAKK